MKKIDFHLSTPVRLFVVVSAAIAGISFPYGRYFGFQSSPGWPMAAKYDHNIVSALAVSMAGMSS